MFKRIQDGVAALRSKQRELTLKGLVRGRNLLVNLADEYGGEDVPGYVKMGIGIMVVGALYLVVKNWLWPWIQSILNGVPTSV